MLEPKTLVPKTDRPLLAAPQSHRYQEPKQRRMMVVALSLLLVALGFVLYRDRDFWFPGAQEAEDEPTQSAPVTTPAQTSSVVAKAIPPAVAAKGRNSTAKPQPKDSTSAAPAAPVATVTNRTVLPPLEVEVVAGDVHSKVHAGSNSIRVNMQPGSPPQTAPDAATASAETAASVTSNAAERVQMSADTTDVVSRPVKPGYPLLARQMKVQGSVILQALISRDGAIQDLHIVSGPPILASAAQEAVRQWHFKPHYVDSETVETQAKITVNFTISTN